ncbi:unnamed protein product [Prunus armeniaca]
MLVTCVLSTGTRKYLKSTGNGETGQPLVHANIARKLETGKLVNHLCIQIEQVAGEILVGQLCTKHSYTQISKGNWERRNWPTLYVVKSGNWEQGNGQTTRAVKSGWWLGKSWLDNCVLSIGTRKYLKEIGNEETGQPPMHSNRAGSWGNLDWKTVY